MKNIKFDKILGIDVETSGFNNSNKLNPAEGYQILSIGLIVADTKVFKPIEELYLEIKWDGESLWDEDAVKIHGFTKQYLDKHGLDTDEAAEIIALFLDKHFGIDTPISLLGHNVYFDFSFLKMFLDKHDLPFKFSYRHIDSFSLSMPTIETFSSDELFEFFGFAERTTHNSLKDIKMTLKSIQLISKMWKDVYG